LRRGLVTATEMAPHSGGAVSCTRCARVRPEQSRKLSFPPVENRVGDPPHCLLQQRLLKSANKLETPRQKPRESTEDSTQNNHFSGRLGSSVG